MKSITIHNLETDLANKIEELSSTEGISQNKLVKALLRKALELDPVIVQRRKHYFDKIFNTLSAEEAKEFYDSTADLSSLELSEWWKYWLTPMYILMP